MKITRAGGGGGDKTREMWLLPQGNIDVDTQWGDTGNWSHLISDATQRVGFTIHIPADWSSLNEIYLVVLPDASETIQIDLLMSISAAGVANNDDEETSADLTKEVVAGVITEWALKGSLTGDADWAVGDYVAFLVASDTANVQVIGMRIDYEIE